MATVAIFSPKGGVGKTSLAVNLAWASATVSSRRTLLWDLDAQGAASFILSPAHKARHQARAAIERDVAATDLVAPTRIAGLDLLAADSSLRRLDELFTEIDAKKRLKRIGQQLAKDYDRVIIDCPPGLGATAEQIIRGADLILLPLIPSVLSTRSAEELREHLERRSKDAPPVLPVFNMVDRRRASHRAALEARPDQPAIPMASAVEQMGARNAPLGAYAPRSPAAQALRTLWTDIERRLVRR
jgi:chromosome partitioning protein